MRRFFVSTIVTMGIALPVSWALAAQRVLVIMQDQQSYHSVDTALKIAKLSGQKNFALKSLSANSLGQVNGYVSSSLKQLRSFVMTVDSAEDVQKLRRDRGVLLVEEEKMHPLPAPVRGRIYKGAKSSILDDPAREVSRLLEGTPWGIVAVKAKAAWAASRKGEGVRVLVLDTGIDRDHPALAANFEVGEDFVNDENLPYPYADQIGHGTHVAGTIAAVEDSMSGFTGVAPAAKILAGRVCGATGCSNIAIAEGINWGIEQRVQVINMSLGGIWSTPAEREAISRAEASGLVVVAASGNSGVGRVSYPAALPTVLAVGAIDSTFKKADFSQWGPELDVVGPGVAVVSTVPLGSGREANVRVAKGIEAAVEVKSSSFAGAKEVPEPLENQLVFAGLGKAEDFANVNVRGKFALVQRGEIKFGEKATNALEAGALGLVIFNNQPGLISGSLTEDGSILDIAVTMIEQIIGEELRDTVSSGGDARAILQTKITDYASFDGTSMASPHVAGVVALVRAANPQLSPQQVRELLRETATPLTEPNPNNEYGSGLVNAEAAVQQAAGL